MTRALRRLAATMLGFVALATAANAAPVDGWTLESGAIDPQRYFGITVANGNLGILSAPAPFDTRHTLIGGVYEVAKPGDISSLLRTFDLLELEFSIDGVRLEH